MEDNYIGVFDSGIGGVTVLKEMIKILPNENFIYYSDSKNNPYGDKSKEEIANITFDIVKFLLEKKCKAIVIACNTASALASQKLRETFKDTIIIAIEPAYKMVYDYGFNDKTLVLATKGTIESEKFLALYHKYDNHKTTLLSCSGLADLIEHNDKLKIKEYLKENLSMYKDYKNVVLGCTHYPLIKDELTNVLGDVIYFDGSNGVSKELERRLREKDLLNKEKSQENKVVFFDSSNNIDKEKRFFEVLNS